jgi:hypothetical protein
MNPEAIVRMCGGGLRDDDVNRPRWRLCGGWGWSADRSLSTNVGQLHGGPGATKYHEESQADHSNWDDRDLGL